MLRIAYATYFFIKLVNNILDIGVERISPLAR